MIDSVTTNNQGHVKTIIGIKQISEVSGSKAAGAAGDEDEEDDEGMVPHVLNPIGNQSSQMATPQQTPVQQQQIKVNLQIDSVNPNQEGNDEDFKPQLKQVEGGDKTAQD